MLYDTLLPAVISMNHSKKHYYFMTHTLCITKTTVRWKNTYYLQGTLIYSLAPLFIQSILIQLYKMVE